MIPWMTCIKDLSDLSFMGNQDGNAGKTIVFEVKTCREHEYCLSEDEINSFVDSHSLVLMMNQ